MNNEFRNDDVINCGDISISMSSMQAYCDKVEITLTRNEFKVFFYLLKNYGKAITREELLNNIWGYDTAIESRAADDTVKRLRRKLNAVNSIVFIDTVWGYGFRIRVDKNLGQDDELKHELFIEFVALGGNYKNINETEALKKKIDKFLEDVGKYDNQLADLSRMLTIFIEEILYDEDFEKFSEMISPVEKRLTYTNIEDWDINDIRLSQAAVTYVGNFKIVDKLMKKSLLAIEMHLKDKPIYKRLFFLYLNVLSCFLKHSFLNVDPTQDSVEAKLLKKFFKFYSNAIMEIYHNNEEELKSYEYVIFIRIALFDRDSESAIEALEKLKKLDDKPLYDVMKKEVVKYSPHFGANITQKQFSMMIGKNIREIRKIRGLSSPELAKKIPLSERHMSAIESGDRNATAITLLKICDILEISVNELFYETEEEK